jgi:hypothetical protein
VLELVEEAFDEVAMSIEFRVDRALDLAVASGRDVGSPTGRLDEVEDGPGIIAAVADEIAPARHTFDQGRHRGLVGSLPRQEHDPDGQSAAVNARVDLGAQSSTRTADGVIRTPFFPPAACWWARTIDESMRWSDCGERAANASKIVSQTPFLAQRLKRLYAVVYGPARAGRATASPSAG